MPLKPNTLTEFYRSLHGRGLDVTRLAAALHCGRSHLSQVLHGTRSGQPTWRKLEKSGLLTPAELRLLGRTPETVPHRTMSHMEHAPSFAEPTEGRPAA